MNNSKYLIVIVGPTAVGKTAMAIQLAQHFQTAIISADARQIYQEMTIGTAKPSPEELNLVPHFLINSHSIHQTYNAGQFEQDALKILQEIYITKNIAILVGGSGLYVNALCEGMDDMPPIDSQIRQKLNERLATEGLVHLLKELAEKDPAYYALVDQQNPQRIIRALEICEATQQPYSSFRKKETKIRPFEMIKIGLEIDREILYQRIDQRMDKMLADGLLDEATQLLPYQDTYALQTVGYQEIFGFLEGKYDWEETVRLLKRNSRRYAKRQLTWFKKDTNITWFHSEDEEAILKFIDNLMIP